MSINFGFTIGDAIVVTGAASGIGKAIAVRAAEMGLSVAAWDLNDDGVHATAEEIRAAGGTVEPSVVDVTSVADIESAFTTARGMGTIRHLANVAGPHSGLREFEFSPSLADAIGSMQNVVNTWLRPGAPGGASLVNISSVAGNVIGTGSAWYSAAKAGIVGWTKHLAAYRSDEVRSNAVGPGTILTTRSKEFANTELGAHILSRVPSGRQGTPDEIAWVVLFLLSPLASYVNGAFLVVDGGWTVTQ